MIKKTLNQWERKNGLMLNGDHDLNQLLTEAEFSDLLNTTSFTGLDWNSREAWLKKHGHAKNRKNLVDGRLKPSESN